MVTPAQRHFLKALERMRGSIEKVKDRQFYLHDAVDEMNRETMYGPATAVAKRSSDGGGGGDSGGGLEWDVILPVAQIAMMEFNGRLADLEEAFEVFYEGTVNA